MQLRTALLGLCALFSGCIGFIGDPPRPEEAEDVLEPAPPGRFEPTLRRLTSSELANSLGDLLGAVSVPPVETDFEVHGFLSVGASLVAVSPDGVAKYEQALDAVTQTAFADATRAASVLTCVPKWVDDEVCTRRALAAFGRRAWRRPLSDEELLRWVSVASDVARDAGDALAGVRYAISGMLQSPNFLYRSELGEPAPEEGGRYEYGAWAMASRLAFILWGSVPDEALLDAAQRGALATERGVRAEATRLLADARARRGVETFFSELYGLQNLAEVFKDTARYPAWTPSLREAMRRDLLQRFTYATFEAPTDVLSLYEDRTVFVNNELARLYGLPEVSGDPWRRAELPPEGLRRGLLGSGALLAMHSLPARSSPTARGKLVAETMLCRSVPSPPGEVEMTLGDGAATSPATLREVLAAHRADPTCAVCHDLMDPLGFGLESFDTTGALRALDAGPVDASGELDGVAFTDLRGFAAALREHPDVESCLTRKLYTWASGRRPLRVEDEAVARLTERFASVGHRLDHLLVEMVASDAFRFMPTPRD